MEWLAPPETIDPHALYVIGGPQLDPVVLPGTAVSLMLEEFPPNALLVLEGGACDPFDFVPATDQLEPLGRYVAAVTGWPVPRVVYGMEIAPVVAQAPGHVHIWRGAALPRVRRAEEPEREAPEAPKP
jgi:hypothetical protein